MARHSRQTGRCARACETATSLDRSAIAGGFPKPWCSRPKALLRGEPLVIDLLRAYPPEEILGRLLVLRIAHDQVRERHVIAELASRTFGQRRVKGVVLERCPVLGQISFGLASGQEIDRGAVAGGTACVRQKGSIV